MYVARPWDNLKGFVAITGISVLAYGYSMLPTTELINPLVQIHPVETVEASKIVVITPQPTQTPVKTERGEIEAYIREVFGDEAENAIKIAACESGFRPSNHGDKHLMVTNKQTGEVVGDSIGIFQIRVGGRDWNRAHKNGMTADQFREKLRRWRYNVDYAKTIYDSRGWSGWHNCMIKEGIK